MTDIIITIRVRAGTPLHRAMYALVSDGRQAFRDSGLDIPGLDDVYRQLHPATVTQRMRYKQELSRPRIARWRACQREQREAAPTPRTA